MRKRQSRKTAFANEPADTFGAMIGHRRREVVGIVMAGVAVIMIFANMLFLQNGPHPAPIFASRPLLKADIAIDLPRPQAAAPVLTPDNAASSRAKLIGDIQRELGRKGFYDGVADGIWGAKTDTAARDFVQATGLKINPEANDALLRAITSSNVKPANVRASSPETARMDPIAALIEPSKRLLAIQRALADFGYGQIKPTGNFDAATRAAIEKFEREHRLPITGQVSEPFVRELAAMTARPLE